MRRDNVNNAELARLFPRQKSLTTEDFIKCHQPLIRGVWGDGAYIPDSEPVLNGVTVGSMGERLKDHRTVRSESQVPLVLANKGCRTIWARVPPVDSDGYLRVWVYLVYDVQKDSSETKRRILMWKTSPINERGVPWWVASPDAWKHFLPAIKAVTKRKHGWMPGVPLQPDTI